VLATDTADKSGCIWGPGLYLSYTIHKFMMLRMMRRLAKVTAPIESRHDGPLATIVQRSLSGEIDVRFRPPICQF
jgi:hypothetical protein